MVPRLPEQLSGECQEEVAAKQALLSCLYLPVSSATLYHGNRNAWPVGAERQKELADVQGLP